MNHADDARAYRAEATELLRLAGADDLAERIVENIEAAAVSAVLHSLTKRLETLADTAAKGALEKLLGREP